MRGPPAFRQQCRRYSDPDIQQHAPPGLPARVCHIDGIITPIRIPIPRLQIAWVTSQGVGGTEGAGAGVLVARQRDAHRGRGNFYGKLLLAFGDNDSRSPMSLSPST
jgi:hypothetical protein